jgi:hypothetical protein
MEPLAEVAGASYIVLNKRSIDNYMAIKDSDGVLQLLEDGFDRECAERQIIALADSFGERDIPLIFVSMPPRFDKDELVIAQELDFFGQRDELMLSVLAEAGIETLDVGNELKNAGIRYIYPFKTDIHLQTAGEIETARLLAGKLETIGIEIENRDIIFDMSNYRIETMDFAGDLIKSSGTLYTYGVDEFELWYPDFETDLTVENQSKKLTKQGPFEKSVMNGMTVKRENALNYTPYWVVNYLQHPSAFYTVDNNINDSGCRLLFLIDSYAMRTAAYLSLGAGHITVIDPRGIDSEKYLKEAVDRGEYDAVIIAAGGKTFYDKIKLE